MPATLTADHRRALLEAGTTVYSAYLLLDLVSNNHHALQDAHFLVNGKKQSLQEYLSTQIPTDAKENEKEADFTFGDLTLPPVLIGEVLSYQLRLKRLSTNEWSIEITSKNPLESKSPLALKPVMVCRPDDIMTLSKQFPLKLGFDPSSGTYKCSAEVNTPEHSFCIGGPDKYELYQLHLNNLYAILRHLQAEQVNPHLLIAMATGSGKTFTQALWYLILHLAKLPCIFTVHSASLAKQLVSDFSKLLPEAVMQALQVFEKEAEQEEQHRLPQWGVMSHEHLLQDHWQDLQEAHTRSSGLLLSFDEEHKATEEELYRKRIKMLANHYPSMFLSATPSEDAYALCGGKALISLSLSDKEMLAASQAALLYQAETRGMVERMHKMAPIALKHRLALGFVGAIEPERTSTVAEYVDQSELAVVYRQPTESFYAVPESQPRNEQAKKKAIRSFLRWNIEAAIGEKALVLMSKHDPVINFSLLSQGDTLDPYKKGNRVSRRNVCRFFGVDSSIEFQCDLKYREAKVRWREQQFLLPLKAYFKDCPEESLLAEVQAQVDFSRTEQYLKHRVLHGLVESALRFLLGYDSNHLDYLRFRDIDQLTREVSQKIAGLQRGGRLDEEALIAQMASELQKKAKTSFPTLARKIATAQFAILHTLEYFDRWDFPEQLTLIVDNWQLDARLHRILADQNPALAAFTKEHATVFLVNGLEKTATPIQSGKPFFYLLQRAPDMDSEEVRGNPALRHELSPIEALDFTASQYVYKPHYCPPEYTEEVLDFCFKEGLFGAWGASGKGLGFNDPHLHHVAMLVDDPEDSLSSPTSEVQGYGRLRGLNPAHRPQFFLARDRATPLSFPLESLRKKDYFPDFFKAQKSYQQTLTQQLGNKIAAQIITYLDATVHPDGTLPTQELQEELGELILSEFEAVYKRSDFDFKKSRKLFSAVLAEVYTTLYAQSGALNKKYGMPRSAQIISAVLNFIMNVYYCLAIAISYLFFWWASRQLLAAAKKDVSLAPEATYTHLVRNYNYKDLVPTGMQLSRFSAVFREAMQKTMSVAFTEEPDSLMEQKSVEKLTAVFKEDISAYFIRFIGTSEQQLALLRMIAAKGDWFRRAFPHLEALMARDKRAVETYFSIISQEPEIANYLADNRLEIDFKREENALEALMQLQFELGVPSVFSNVLRLPPPLSKKLIEGLLPLLHPRDALFLAQHKDQLPQLQFPLSDLKGLQEAGDKLERLPLAITLLRNALPSQLQRTAEAAGCLDAQVYDLAKFEDLQGEISAPQGLFGPAALRGLLAKNMEHYLKSPILRQLIQKILGPLNEQHLLTLLNAIYPGEDNAVKKDRLLQFQKDLTALSSAAIFDKYAIFEIPPIKNKNDKDELTKVMLKTDIYQVFKWLGEIHQEILSCECHWHYMDEKGGDHNYSWGQEEKPPKLLNGVAEEKAHPIWAKHGTTANSPVPRTAKRIQFVQACQRSFPGLHEIEKLRYKNTAAAMRETAGFFVNPLKAALQGLPAATSKTYSTHQRVLAEGAKQLGQQMRKARSFTDAEVADPATKEVNAVQRLRPNK